MEHIKKYSHAKACKRIDEPRDQHGRRKAPVIEATVVEAPADEDGPILILPGRAEGKS
jgi:hypothetical protein